MAVGNRVAKEVGILSCANVVDFRTKEGSVVNKQTINPYIDAKMTYRLDKIVERQAEFRLDLPIFLTGGIGTDFEYALEEVSRKVGSTHATPVLLFGTPDYWEEKTTSCFPRQPRNWNHQRVRMGQQLLLLRPKCQAGSQSLPRFLHRHPPIGKHGPVYSRGFAAVKN